MSEPMQEPLRVTEDELYALLGRQLVEIRLLRARLDEVTSDERRVASSSSSPLITRHSPLDERSEESP